MTYIQTLHLIAFLEQEDKAIIHKIALVSAIDGHLDLFPYDQEGFEELCARIDAFVRKQSNSVDYDDFMYCVNDLIENGKYETPTEECLAEAWDWASALD